jgi:hypothetical protein
MRPARPGGASQRRRATRSTAYGPARRSRLSVRQSEPKISQSSRLRGVTRLRLASRAGGLSRSARTGRQVRSRLLLAPRLLDAAVPFA